MAEADIPSPEISINSNAVSPGTSKLIRCDGNESVFTGKASTSEIRRFIGCDMLDTVRVGPRRELTMFNRIKWAAGFVPSAWSNLTTYATGDAGNVGKTPTGGAPWALLVQQGSTGPTGPIGPTVPQVAPV